MLVKPVYDAALAHFLREIGERRATGIARFPSRWERRARCKRMLRCSVIRSDFYLCTLDEPTKALSAAARCCELRPG
jgi:hypothetical protein